MFALFCTAVPLITAFIMRRQLLTEQKISSATEITQKTYIYAHTNNEVTDNDHFSRK